MDDKQFEQQMKLLKKSYDRVPSKFNMDDVLGEIEAEGKQPKEIQSIKTPVASKWQKVSVWAVSLASMFLIGLLSASFMNDGNENGDEPVAEYDANDIETLKKAYQLERDKRQKILGLTNNQFDQLAFVKSADQIFAEAIHPDRIETYQYSNLTLEENYQEIIKNLRLPSEMVEIALKIENNSEQYSEQYSREFADDLNRKIDDLKYVFDGIIFDHSEIMNTARTKGKLDVNSLYGNQSQLPEDIINILDKGTKQGLFVEVAPDGNNFEANFQMTSSMRDLEGILTENAIDMLEIKELAPFTYGGELIYDTQQSAYYLQRIEGALLNSNLDLGHGTLASIKTYYEDLAYTLIFNSTQIIENQKVKDEYQQAWNILRLTPGSSPIRSFISPLIDAMSENGWVVKETYQNLDFEDLKELFRQAENGELEELKNYGTGLHSETINWPNSNIQQKVHGYLKSSGQSDDSSYLIDVSPVEILVLYDYAQQKYIPEINYTLLSPYEGSGNMDEVMNAWLQRVLITENVTSIRYLDDKSFEQNGRLYGHVDIMNEDRLIHSIPMVLNEIGVWQIDANSIFPKYTESLIVIDDEIMDSIQSLYKQFKNDYDYSILNEESALTVAGIYLEASAQGDLETQYELLVKGENFITPTREEFLSYPPNGGLDWKEQFKSFELEQVESPDKTGEFKGVAWFGLKDEFVTEDESEKGFQMRKTVDGWRVHFMAFQ